MAKSSWERKIEDLNRQLTNSQLALTVTNNQYHVELDRISQLIPTNLKTLLAVYPPLGQLLHHLTDAVDLADPLRGAPTSDTMRTEYTPDGETLTPTEQAVITHAKPRGNVATIIHELEWATHRISQLIPGTVIGYTPPDQCTQCGKLIFQPATGRKRSYCSTRCRMRTLRNVTKPETTVGS